MAQVTFIVQTLPANTPPQDSLFIAGNFTGWEPGSPQYQLHKNAENKWSITLANQANGTIIKFKFTRGSWTTVEKGPGGEEIADRSFTFGNGDSVDVIISRWADAGGGSTSTAAANVKIMSNDFFMPQINRTRRIWIYYPPGYETSGISYPVLYMHDGQNLFDAATSYSGEWEVDETLNKLAAQGKKVPIVVGIDNGGGDRIGEYTPWANSQYGGGDGEKYMQFIVETLKPYIDQHYRTLPDRENTGILGSSLGGLISHYGSLRYQGTFSKVGLFSPSYWFSDNIWAFTHSIGLGQNLRFFQLCGTGEGAGVQSDMQRMNDSLVSMGFGQDNIFNKIVAGGEHNEKLWREAFGEAYTWLFNNYVNSIEDVVQHSGISCFPNPVADILTFQTDGNAIFDTVFILDMNGREVKMLKQFIDNKIDVRDLPQGTYIIRGSNGKIIREGKFIKN
ncbi:MAG: alpha/beta hydrolase-fold protein [Bacteroidota bacterium]